MTSRRAESSGAIILSNGAAGVLRFDPDVLRVAVTAPVKMRIKRVMALEEVDRRTARRRIQAAHAARRVYLARIGGVAADDPGLFQLTLDSLALPVDSCIELMVVALRNRGLVA